MEKKLKDLISCSRQETINCILAGVNMLLGVLGVSVSLWYLLLLIPAVFFMCMAIYWGIQYSQIEMKIAREQDEERKKTLAFADELLENNSAKDLKDGICMNKDKLNYVVPNNSCKFELSYEDTFQNSEWYQVEMYSDDGNTYLGRLQIVCDKDKAPAFTFTGHFIRTKVNIYTWGDKWYFQYKLPDIGPFDGMDCLTSYLDSLHVEALLLQDLEKYVRQLVSD